MVKNDNWVSSEVQLYNFKVFSQFSITFLCFAFSMLFTALSSLHFSTLLSNPYRILSMYLKKCTVWTAVYTVQWTIYIKWCIVQFRFETKKEEKIITQTIQVLNINVIFNLIFQHWYDFKFIKNICDIERIDWPKNRSYLTEQNLTKNRSYLIE